MILRRVREHVSHHNWFAVLIDVAIVVLGVFLGLQANNWNEKRVEAEQARSYRARLIDELDFNAHQFAQQIAYYRQARDYGLEALAAVKGERPLSDREVLIASYQLSQVDTTKAKTYIYDEMTSNGLVDRLGDEEIQQQASDYYLNLAQSDRWLQETLPYRTVIRQVMPYDLQFRIRTACGDRDVLYNRRLVGVRLVVPCPADIDPVAAARGVRIVRRTPDLAALMTRYLASIDDKLDNLKRGLRQSIAFRDALASAARASS